MNNRTFLSVFLFVVSFLLTISISGQPTGILLNTEDAYEGYTLFSASINWPNEKVFLIDNCGNIINEWSPGNISYHCKLLPNGNLLYTQNDKIFEMNWDGEVVFTTTPKGSDSLYLRYEVLPIDNDSYLCVGRRRLDSLGFEEIGYNQQYSFVIPTVIDVVSEIKKETGELLWEWKISDHVIQERDSLIPNYGSINENPQLLNVDAVSLLDMTYGESFMINGMDYNPKLDQIALSVRKLSEVIIIDHSTTTEEAAGSTGGNSGKGGDILYRWGNPQNYGYGLLEDQELFYQHNPNWITEGPHTDQLMIFDNGLTRPDVFPNEPYSRVLIIEPPIDQDGNYILNNNKPFGPELPAKNYSWENGDHSFYSKYRSGAKWMPNGNLFITAGDDGDLMELNADGELVWSYRVPSINSTFRAEKYPLDYAAFENKDLTPKGQIDWASSTYECSLLTNTIEKESSQWKVDVHVQNQEKAIIIKNESVENLNYALFDITGRTLQNGKCQKGSTTIRVVQNVSNIYFISVWHPNGNNILTKRLFINN